MLTKRKDGRYCKSVTIDKKRIYFYSSEQTERKAEKDIERQLIEYSQKKEQGYTFKAVSELWEKEHFPTLAYNTLKQYRPALAECTDYFKDDYIKDITSVECKRYIDIASKGRAKKTASTRLLVLNLIMKYAVVNKYIDHNPCLYITIPKGLSKTYRSMASETDVKAVKENLNIPMGMYAYLVLMTGCRRNEACALKVSDIDFENKLITVSKSLYTADDNKTYIKLPKTEKGIRKIIMPDELEKSLKKYVKGKKASDILFPNSKGEYMNNGEFDYHWRVYQKQTGITATPHMLRHSYASMLLEAGIDTKIAQDQLGHATMQMTVDTYAHISESWKTEASDKLNAFMKKKK